MNKKRFNCYAEFLNVYISSSQLNVSFQSPFDNDALDDANRAT